MSNSNCPDDDQITRYAAGLIPAEDVPSLEKHVSACEECAETFNIACSESEPMLSLLKHSSTTAGPEYTNEPAYQSAASHAVNLFESSGIPSGGFNGGNSDRPEEDLTGQRIGQYEVERVIGRGGMGVVYLARHTKLNRLVALKVLPHVRFAEPQTVQRFEREIEAVGRAQHPNIVQAFDADEVNGVHYLAMEFVDGLNLSEVLKKNGPLSIADACEIVRQAALGLEHAHQLGLIHRDLKPANLMLTSQGHVRILDLGLALLQTDSETAVSELTTTGQLMGTLDYMSPEQADNTHDVDIQTDIYSLGATLYALLCGQPPFAKDQYRSPLKRMVALAHDSPVPVHHHRTDIPKKLSKIIQQMLEKAPGNRPETAADVKTSLEPFSKKSELRQLVAGLPVEGTQRQSDGVSALPSGNEATSDTPAIALASSTSPEKPHGANTAKSFSPETQRTAWFLLSTCKKNPLTVAALSVAFAAMIIFSLRTPVGTIILEMDPDQTGEAYVEIDGDNVVTIDQGKDGKRIELKADEESHLLSVKMEGFQTFTKEFSIVKNEEIAIRVRLVPETADIPPEDSLPGTRENAPTSLTRPEISAYELAVAGHGDPQAAPKELVAIFGDSRFTQSVNMDSIACGPNDQAATVIEGGVAIWNLRSGEVVTRFTDNGSFGGETGQLDWHTQTKRIVGVEGAGGCIIIDAETGITQTPEAEESVCKDSPIAIQISSDGQFFVVAYQNGTIQMRNTNDGKLIRTVLEQDRTPSGIDISPNGKKLAVAFAVADVEDGGEVRIYAIEDGRQILEIRHKSPRAVRFSPDGSRIAVAGYDVFSIRDTATGDVINEFSDEHRVLGISGIDFLGDNDTLVFSAASGVHVWDVKQNEEVGCVQTAGVLGAAGPMDVSDDGRWIAIAGRRSCQMLALLSKDIRGKADRTLAHPWGRLATMDLSEDGRFLAIAGHFSSSIEIRETATGDFRTIDVGQGISSVCFNMTGGHLAVLTSYGVCTVDLHNDKVINTRTNVQQDGHGIAFVREADQILTASQSAGGIQFWTERTLDLIKLNQNLEKGTIALAVSDSGRCFAVSTRTEIVMRETNSKDVLWKTPGMSQAIAIHPNNRFVAFSSNGPGVFVHSVDSVDSIRHFKAAAGRPTTITWNRTGTLLGAADEIGHVTIWDDNSGEQLYSWKLPGRVEALRFSPDSRHCFAACVNKAIYMLTCERNIRQ